MEIKNLYELVYAMWDKTMQYGATGLCFLFLLRDYFIFKIYDVTFKRRK